jgi:hypothetical protein
VLEVEPLQIEKQRSVLRLHLSEGHPSVIAKRCPAKDAEREFVIYHDILPSFGIKGPEAHGLVCDDINQPCWLFMEEIGGRPYDSSSKTDRELAGEWLATLHAGTSKPPDHSKLGDRSADYYQPCVGKSIELLEQHRDNPDLNKSGRDLLKRIHDFCTVLDAHWPDIAAFCQSMPQTLIHGDFKEDNMKVVDTNGGPYIVVFDWANSGWGAPGLDLAKFTGYGVAPDLDHYLSISKRCWPTIDKASIVRLGYIGEIFRWVETIRWDVEELNYGLGLSVMARMTVYEMWMNEIAAIAPWMETDLVSSGRWKPLQKHWH